MHTVATNQGKIETHVFTMKQEIENLTVRLSHAPVNYNPYLWANIAQAFIRLQETCKEASKLAMDNSNVCHIELNKIA